MKNSLVVYVEPSRKGYPGHMVVGQEGDMDDPKYFGFRYDAAKLPSDSAVERTRLRYLAANAVSGGIIDELAYVDRLLAAGTNAYREMRVEFTGDIEDALPKPQEWWTFARYSFNPDNFHSLESPCYNCVTWAISTANLLVESFLPTVYQGRIGTIYDYLGTPGVRPRENS